MNSLDRLWRSALREITINGQEIPSRGGPTKEVISYRGFLSNPLQNVLLNPHRKFSLSYACAEVLWYLSGQNEIDMIKAYTPQYERFAEDGIAFGAYGHRWQYSLGGTQLHTIVDILKVDPESRQAVMCMWDKYDLIHAYQKDKKDLPCTLNLQFLLRDNHLHCITTMRSNDVWLGFPYDIFAFTTIQRIIAEALAVNLSFYYHNAGSEHLYHRNKEGAIKACRWFVSDTKFPFFNNVSNDILRLIPWAIELERKMRGGEIAYEDIIQLPSVLKDLLLGAATKFTKVDPVLFDNRLFAELVK